MSGPMSNPTHIVVAGTRRSWTREQKRAILSGGEEVCDDGVGSGAPPWRRTEPAVPVAGSVQNLSQCAGETGKE